MSGSLRVTIAAAVARGLECGFDQGEVHGPELLRVINAMREGLERRGYQPIGGAIAYEVLRAVVGEGPL